MKKGVMAFVLPLLYLCGTSALTQKDRYYSFKMWMDEVVKGEPAIWHFDCWATTSYPITLTRYTFTVTQGSISIFSSPSASSELPITLSQGGSHFTLDKKIPTWNLSASVWEVNFILFGIVKSTSSSHELAVGRKIPHGPGKAYYSSDKPYVVTSDITFKPGRSSYDFVKKEDLFPFTKSYVFEGLMENSTQYLRSFLLAIKGVREENQGEEKVLASDATLTIFGHEKEYGQVADWVSGDGSEARFDLVPIYYSGALGFSLKNPYTIHRCTGVLKKGKPTSSDEISTRYVPMPMGVEETSSLYSWQLDFLMDGNDWVRIRGVDRNPHAGVSGGNGAYRVVLGGF